MSLRLAMNSLAFIRITSLSELPERLAAGRCRAVKTKKMSHIILVIYSEEERGGTDGLWWSVSQETVGMCILTSVGLRVRPGFFFLRS